MRTIPNKRLARNFWLYEFIEAHPTRNQDFIRLNWQHIADFSEANALRLAEFLQNLRNEINEEFISDIGAPEIGIRLTSAFRCPAWEILRKRPQNGQHTMSYTGDIQITGVSLELGAKILAWIHKKLRPLKTGHQGGLALKTPTFNARRKMIKMGFLHIDFGPRRRWTYP